MHASTRVYPMVLEALMKLSLAGSCQCGKIRYEITEAPQLVYTCLHRLSADHEQRLLVGNRFAGGRLATLPRGEPRPLRRMADSGRLNTRFVCSDCACWLYSLPRDGVIRVRAGTLADTSWLQSTRHIWVRSKQPWVGFDEGDEIFEGQPPG